MNDLKRREFVKFLAASAMALSSGCTNSRDKKPLFGIKPSSEDELVLSEGLKYNVLIKEGDKLTNELTFGHNNDYLAFFKRGADEALLWVNHEYPLLQFIHGERRIKPTEKTKKMVDKEREVVGGAIVHLKRKDKSSQWEVVKNSSKHKRLDGTTPIPLIAKRAIAGRKTAIGTFANCAGGVTPWGTILTCEENVHDYYGDREHGKSEIKKSRLGWERFYNNPPEHYGWVVEVNPDTGESKKLISLGRFAHECATCIRSKDGRVVVYSGDDKGGEFIYKFISNSKDDLHEGKLYVADVKNGKWLSLNWEDNKVLQEHFKDQVEINTFCRKAGRLVGASHMDRPEDIEIHPKTGDVFITLTNNKKRGNFHGSILKISEKNGDHQNLEFVGSNFLVGGKDFSCPDNLAFDSKGNLWMVTDISGSAMNKMPYNKFKNNGLFYIPLYGPHAGKVIQVASAPRDAELTGLCFSDDHQSLFLSVQHPGELSPTDKELTSHWPLGGSNVPRSSVVEITGPLLKELLS